MKKKQKTKLSSSQITFDSTSSGPGKAPRTVWSPSHVTLLLQIIADHMRDNKIVFTDSGFKSVDWQLFADKFANVSGKQYSKSIIESKLSEQKKKFVALKSVLRVSGFGFNESSGLPMAPKEVKDTYLLANPKKSFLFSKKLENLELLRDIFTGKVTIFISSFYYEVFKILTLL